MHRRTTLSLAVAAAASALAFSGPAAAQQTIKIGAVAPKTGPLAGGAAVTQWPSIKMWVTQVNDRGGLKMKDGSMRKIELIEYDDRTNPGETIKAVERLATQDKADFIVAPYGTGLNLASAPVFAKYGYPQIAVSAITDKGPELTKRYPTLFLTLGSTTSFANSVADILKALVDQGKIGKKVAMVNVADAFGIELAEAARPIFKQHGLELVFDKSYPLGTQDMAPIMKGAKATNPDAFVAWSYPPDTFALAELAKIEGLDVKAYYSAVATCFPAFGGKFGKSAEGILGAGGIDPDSPDMKGYFENHKRITGVDADYWAGPVTYASLQVLEQAIEGTGGVDRAAVTDYIKKNSFKTVLGTWTFKNQVIENYWTVGQWQGGKFVGVASTGKPGEKPVQLKSGW